MPGKGLETGQAAMAREKGVRTGVCTQEPRWLLPLLKVRVTGGIEGMQGEPGHSALGSWWSLDKSSGLRLRVTLTQHIC